MVIGGTQIVSTPGAQSAGGQIGAGASGQIAIYGAGNIAAGDPRLTDSGTLLSYTGTSGISIIAAALPFTNGVITFANGTGGGLVGLSGDSFVHQGPNCLDIGNGTPQDISGQIALNQITVVGIGASSTGGLAIKNDYNFPATAIANVNTPKLVFQGSVWNGSIAVFPQAILQELIGTGTNGSVTLSLNFSNIVGGQPLAFSINQGAVIGWGTNGVYPDTAFSRTGAGVIALGNGTQADASGTLALATLSGSPNFSGAATGQTAAVNDNSTKLATTAYIDRTNVSGIGAAGWKEDFFSVSLTSNSIALTRTQMPCDTGWMVQSAAHTGTAAGQGSSSWQNPGTISLATAATATGDALMIYKTIGQGNEAGVIGSNAPWEFNCIFQLQVNTNVCARIGFANNLSTAGTQPTDGIFMEFDTANVGNSDTKFTWVTVKAAAINYSVTNAIAVNTGWNHLRIRSTAAGNILFSINGGTEASINTDIPTVALGVFAEVVTRTTSAQTLALDFMSYVATPTRT